MKAPCAGLTAISDESLQGQAPVVSVYYVLITGQGLLTCYQRWEVDVLSESDLIDGFTCVQCLRKLITEMETILKNNHLNLSSIVTHIYYSFKTHYLPDSCDKHL